MAKERTDAGFIPRDYQYNLMGAIARKKYNRGFIVWARRNGKDKACFNLMADRAIRDRVGNYFYVFPTYSQGREALWDNIDNDGFRTIGHVPQSTVASTNETKMQIDLTNGSTIRIIGADKAADIDRHRGGNPVGIVFSEWAFMNPYAWDVFRPVLAVNEGWAIFNTTPNGPNHAKEMWDMALGNDAWFTQFLTCEDTGFPTQDVIEAEREEGVPEERIQQEYYCSWEGIQLGSYYGKLLQIGEEEGRIGIVPFDPALPVDTAWDIGYGDATAIWFLQEAPTGMRAIDYLEESGEGVEYYAAALQSKVAEHGYVWGKHYAPHDIDHGEWGKGESRLITAMNLGIDFEVAPRLGVDEGIEATARLIRRMSFDREKCKTGLSALYSYHREYDEQRRTYREKPFHDWASHGADALRTYAVCDHRSMAPAERPHVTRVTHRRPRGSGPSTGWLGR